MSTDKTLRSNKTKRLALIIIGIAVAAVLTWSSRDLLALQDFTSPFQQIQLTEEKDQKNSEAFSVDASSHLDKVAKFVADKASEIINK